MAIGFTSQGEGGFFIFTVSVLTAVFVIELVTIVRLVDTAVQTWDTSPGSHASDAITARTRPMHRSNLQRAPEGGPRKKSHLLGSTDESLRCGVVAAVSLMVEFLSYQRWQFR